MKRSRSLLAILLLVVPLCLLGFTAARAAFSIDPTILEVDDETPEIGTFLHFEVFTDPVLEGQKCILLAGTEPGPTMGIPVGGIIVILREGFISGTVTPFRVYIPKNPNLVGLTVYFAAVTINSKGTLTSVSNGVDVEIIDQEDIPG